LWEAYNRGCRQSTENDKKEKRKESSDVGGHIAGDEGRAQR
jgi:hypothetical protein